MTISATSLTNIYSGTATNTVAGSSTEASNSFHKVMGNVTNGNGKSNGNQQNTNKTDQDTSTKVTQKNINVDRTNTVKNATQKTVGDKVTVTDDKDITDDVMDEVNEKASEMIAAIAEQLGVTQKEIENAMETLGMTNGDLFNSDMLSQLVVNLSGEEDMMSLVMDETLYGSLNSLLDTAKELVSQMSDTWDISMEDMPAFLQNVTDELQNMAETDAYPREAEQTSVLPTEQPEVEVNYQTTAENSKAVVEMDDKTATQLASEEESAIPEETDIQEKPITSVKGQGETQEQHTEHGYQEGSNSFLQSLTETAAALAEKASGEVENTSFSNTLDTQGPESIMRQMIDYMRVHINDNVSEMEIQLHPASLGTVNLNIASKNGSITAQFAAQNETVKAALEAQVIQLRENLDERGIKVDAIEVTIASHEFERNLEQGEQEARDSERTEAAKKSGRRRIVLNPDETEGVEDMDMEQLDEADRIQVALMQQNGNTVSLKA